MSWVTKFNGGGVAHGVRFATPEEVVSFAGWAGNFAESVTPVESPHPVNFKAGEFGAPEPVVS